MQIFFMDSDGSADAKPSLKISATDIESAVYYANALLTREAATTVIKIADMTSSTKAAQRTSIIYPTSANLDVYKGVEVLPIITGDGNEGTYGANYYPNALCHYSYSVICSTNQNSEDDETFYISDADGKQYLFNQWHNYDNRYGLHLVYYSGVTAANICRGYENIQDGAYRGVVMKDVKLSPSKSSLSKLK